MIRASPQFVRKLHSGISPVYLLTYIVWRYWIFFYWLASSFKHIDHIIGSNEVFLIKIDAKYFVDLDCFLDRIQFSSFALFLPD